MLSKFSWREANRFSTESTPLFIVKFRDFDVLPTYEHGDLASQSDERHASMRKAAGEAGRIFVAKTTTNAAYLYAVKHSDKEGHLVIKISLI